MLPIIPLAIGVGAVVAGAAVPLMRASERRLRVAGAKASARAAYRQLGFCVETVPVSADADAAEELARATERWHTAGALLADATNVEQCMVAEKVVAEGMEHVAKACGALGIDPPEVASA